MYTLAGISTSLRLRAARVLLNGLKASIEAGERDGAAHALQRGQSLLGGRASARAVADIVTGRMDQRLSHEQASAAFNDVFQRLRHSSLPPTGWFVLENLSRAVGCFVASQAFGEHARALIVASRLQNDRQRTELFLAHLHSRDIDSAIQTWHTRVPASHTAEFWTDAGHLLWLLTAGEHGMADLIDKGSWSQALRGQQVVAMGPAPSSLTTSGLDDALVARVIAPGMTTWPSTDQLGGQCDLAYANSDTTKWFIAHEGGQSLADFSFVSFRTSSWKAMALTNARTARHHKALLPMPFDKTNMVPLIAWDVLHVPDVQLQVAGTTFFASRTAYTSHDVRLKEDRGGHTDQRGSTGIPFERCLSFSSHNLSAHHTLMSLLAEAGALSFDPEGSAVVGLSMTEYLREIDTLYGVGAV